MDQLKRISSPGPPPGVRRMYRTVIDQQTLIAKLYKTLEKQPLLTSFIMTNPEIPEFFIMAYPSFVAWKSAFRAFNLHRYGKGRASTLGCAFVNCCAMSMNHYFFIKEPLWSPYRVESSFYYGVVGGLGHMVTMPIAIMTSLVFPFIIAQRFCVIPVPDNFLVKQNRAFVWDFFKTKLRPFKKVILKSSLISIAAAGLFSSYEYYQTTLLLERLGESAIAYRDLSE